MNLQAIAEIPTSVRRWKAYPSYKDSGSKWLGVIPEHWEVKRIKFLASFYGGGTPSKENLDYWIGDIPWVSPKDMKAEIVNDSEDHINKEALATSATQLVQSGAVLVVVRSGILKHSIPVAVNSRAVALNQDMKALVPRRELSADYLKYLIVGHQDALLVEWRKAGATVESIEHELLVNSYFPIPSLGEQRSIVDLLDWETAKIDALVAKKERLIELLQEKRAALITRAVTKGLDPNVPMKDSGVEWLGEIPAHWESLALSRVTLSKCDGPFGSGLKSEHYSEGGVRIVRLQNIGWTQFLDQDRAYIDEHYANLLGDHSVQSNDLLVAGLGDEGHPVGRACVAPCDIEPAMVKADCFRFRLDRRQVFPRFVAYQLSATALAAGGSLATGATRARMNLSATATRKVALPPPDEQRIIVDVLDREAEKHLALIAKIREGIEKLKEYRTALISAAVTGKIDVRHE